MWKPDRDSAIPLYRQIADHLHQMVIHGEYPPGSPLPSERKLAEQFEVNRSTVVLAYAELRSLGLVESRPGSKTQVSSSWSPAANRTPEWHRYAENGGFLPNLPFLRRIRDALAQDASIIDFASGKLSTDLSPIREINDIMHSCTYHPDNGSDVSQGFPPLREALATFLEHNRGIQTSASSILITSGSQQSLYLISQCLLSHGDAIAVETPSFTRSLSMFQSAGLRIHPLPMDEQGVRPESIRELYSRHRIKMLFVNPNFQNPTGTLLQADRKKQLLDTASELGLPIVEDDPLSLTAYSNDYPLPIRAEDASSNTLYIGSFSKIAASGLRIGWIVAPKSVISRLADARRQMDMGFSVIPQQIAAAFIKSPLFLPHMERLRSQLQQKLDLLVTALRHHMDGLVQFSVPQGGMHLWCRVVPKVHDGRLLDEALKRSVAFVPGSVYGAEPGYMRLTYARPQTEEIEEGIKKLAEALRATTE
ncbi:PLP-dependent aminotransferase family protein [Paenibacillus sp. 1011MAR3C5]|uniref:MocR-like pyridoxine biosynthesis transcription factor PdxR n=1 Tax=Paenibacillus sp. 1011MAR3C5 TaxID=1675787 RepID=UPI000E6C503E|nr:PLP-dependent aminotransferase family protein [Paenibacillus sp. 1011MAR3C5]RJE90839.1 PLP-dependent aminotransferase family protein [Paenibacillus sp. 1011MAR3C5]